MGDGNIKKYQNVSEILFDEKLYSASDYIKKTKELFGSPFFEALRVYLSENEKSGGFIQSILDCSILDAKEIRAELIQSRGRIIDRRVQLCTG
jgi:hypothetical protein